MTPNTNDATFVRVSHRDIEGTGLDEKKKRASRGGETVATNYENHRLNAVTSAVAAMTYVVGFTLYLTVLRDVADSDLPRLDRLSAIRDNDKLYYFSNVVLYLIFGLAQLVLALGMSKRLHRAAAIELASLSYALGAIWAGLVLASGMIGNIGVAVALELLEDSSAADDGGGDTSLIVGVATSVATIGGAVGGGNELVGGLWVFLVAIGELRVGKSTCLARTTVGTGLVAGLAGIVSIVPVLADVAGAVFGIVMIVWYSLNAALLLRGEK